MEEINRHCFDNGVVLTQLVLRKKRLEARFLSLQVTKYLSQQNIEYMITLIRTEWLKMRKYNAFWWIIGITALSYPGINYMFYKIYEDITNRPSNVGTWLSWHWEILLLFRKYGEQPLFLFLLCVYSGGSSDYAGMQ